MSSDTDTRARLLSTGVALFGERGFKRVTVREICRAANANVAAVNYHFGDKVGLYREVIQTAIDAMRATSESARAAGAGQTAEEKLRRFLQVFLARVLDPENAAVHRLIHREMGEPTAALDELVEQGLKPRIEYLSGVVAEIAGCDPKDPLVLHCVGSIQSQAVMQMPKAIATRLGMTIKPTASLIEKAADHIATFSIAGIRAVAAPGPSVAKGKSRSRGVAARTPRNETTRAISGRTIGSAGSRRRVYPAR